MSFAKSKYCHRNNLEKYPNNKAIKEGHTMCSVAVEKRKMELPFELMPARLIVGGADMSQ